MIPHQVVLPPEFIYPIEDWRLVEKRFAPHLLAQSETLFSTSNGYLGMRGSFEEGTPAFQHGTFINSFYDSWSIPYGEKAFGFATTGQTIVNVPDGKIFRLYIDDEFFHLKKANVLRFERALDMRSGTLDREVLWETPSGKQVLIKSRRLVSFEERHLAAISYEVTLLDAKAPVVISSQLLTHDEMGFDPDDPRKARGFTERVLLPESNFAENQRIVLGYATRNSRMRLVCGIDHVFETDCDHSVTRTCSDEGGAVVFSADAEPGQAIRITKYITYHTSERASNEELRYRTQWTLDRAVDHGFPRLLADQKAALDDFWDRSDIQVSGEHLHPRAQQSVRWNLFQLFQATARTDGMGIPAKGLTGQTYDGHFFWDMEMYVVPFLIYTAPRLARNVLMFRYNMLDQARQRARQVSQRGALFPWRTINGEEASAYYAAGTAQYHINAAVAYAIQKYVDVTGDREFLHQYGTEILVETARLWFDLGFFSERTGGKFVIHGVTGPDEYTTVVNNNTYTNLMARENLWCAVAAVRELSKERPEQYTALVHATGLNLAEVDDWKRAADNMYVPFDERLGIHPQDDSFLDREVWDFENTPPEKYPLLLYHHPLVIYRHQVIKQADIVLAMFLLGHEFSTEQKRRNFDYYDPLTTGDSSLSVCIQSILAAEIGRQELSVEYLRYAVLMDLADVGGNVKDGCHIASMGGTWMALVYGFAGLRDHGGKISFHPRRLLRAGVTLKFQLAIAGQRLEVVVEKESCTYRLREGRGLTIWHWDEEVRLSEAAHLTVPITRETGA